MECLGNTIGEVQVEVEVHHSGFGQRTPWSCWGERSFQCQYRQNAVGHVAESRRLCFLRVMSRIILPLVSRTVREQDTSRYLPPSQHIAICACWSSRKALVAGGDDVSIMVRQDAHTYQPMTLQLRGGHILEDEGTMDSPVARSVRVQSVLKTVCVPPLTRSPSDLSVLVLQ